jgi:hypothetical protein
MRKRRDRKKGGGGFVPTTNSARWRSKGGTRTTKNIDATQSVPNLPNIFSSAKHIAPSRQSVMFMEQNDSAIGGAIEAGDERHTGKPPRRNSIKSASWPEDPPAPKISRRPSVTFLPFALRALPLLQKSVNGNGRMKIATMKTKRRINKFQEAFDLNEPSGGSMYINVWWQDEPNGTKGLLTRANHFHYLKQQRRKRTNVQFPGGFKRSKFNSTAYYSTTTS